MRAISVSVLYRPMNRRFEKVHFALGAENGVVQLHRQRKHSFIRDVNVSLGHDAKSPKWQ